MTETRAWFNVGAVKLPTEERDVAASVFAEHPERFYDVLGADVPDDDEQFPVGVDTAYSAHLTEREAERFSRASNCRYVEPDQRHGGVTCANPYLPVPRVTRYMQADADAYPSLTGTGVLIAIIDSGNTTAARAVKNVSLISRAVFTDTAPVNEVWSSGEQHGNLTMGLAVPYGGQVVDAIGIDGNNSATDSGIASAITWSLGRGVSLINMSLKLSGYSSVVNDALASANSQDTAIIVAAGNDGTRGTVWPARANEYMPYVHSVMSVDMSVNQRSSFTNYGPWQTGMAPGELTFTTTRDGEIAGFFGTSASAPAVVNMAARIMSAGVSAKQAAAALKATVRDIGVTDGQGATLGLYSMQAALRWLNKEPPIVITSPGRPQKPGLPIW